MKQLYKLMSPLQTGFRWHRCDCHGGQVTLAPSSMEGSADSQAPIGGRPLPAFLGMARFICMPSVRDRSLTHTRRGPQPNCTGVSWSWPQGGWELWSHLSCPHLPHFSWISFSVCHLWVSLWSVFPSFQQRGFFPPA